MKSSLRRGMLLRLEPFRLLESCLYGVFEYVLITVVAAWSGSWFGAFLKPNGVDSSLLRHWILGMGLVWAAKLTYLFFLIWNVPLYLVLVVDVLSILWLFQAVATALRIGRLEASGYGKEEDSPKRGYLEALPHKGRTFLVTLLIIGTRFLYRSFTTWNSLFLTADLLMDVLA